MIINNYINKKYLEKDTKDFFNLNLLHEYENLDCIIISNTEKIDILSLNEDELKKIKINILKNRFGSLYHKNLYDLISELNKYNIKNIEILEYNSSKYICNDCSDNYEENYICNNCFIKTKKELINKYGELPEKTDLYLNCNFDITNEEILIFKDLVRIKNIEALELYQKIKNFNEN